MHITTLFLGLLPDAPRGLPTSTSPTNNAANINSVVRRGAAAQSPPPSPFVCNPSQRTSSTTPMNGELRSPGILARSSNARTRRTGTIRICARATDAPITASTGVISGVRPAARSERAFVRASRAFWAKQCLSTAKADGSQADRAQHPLSLGYRLSLHDRRGSRSSNATAPGPRGAPC